MARHEVVKKMWGLIKEKNLYDPKNKQFAICNAELLPVFGMLALVLAHKSCIGRIKDKSTDSIFFCKL